MSAATKWVPIACIALIAVVLARVFFVYDALPDIMASHFDLAGKADGFMRKAKFVKMLAVIQVVIPGFNLLAGLLLRRMPDRLINLPNKDYWLAPERRAASLARLAGLANWMTLGVTVLLAVVIEQTVRANLGDRTIPAVWVDLALFAVFFVGWMVCMSRAFARPPAA